ncbi:hypothetical protein BEP19_00605 [Ammoniphilus oxalaticus]|uniref:DUF2975 domain-containing protein n=1 Tax=Ammoniphilus oxalaticus TaxID=66863 RepID=A0A419SRC9_9BACL|nr:DUF2975 domain-containing protein [Ammoniphilus oxalaticus]RKD27106.1 hypothetical protein BEP19_00605 [Ammoniphilus oxalaticus]
MKRGTITFLKLAVFIIWIAVLTMCIYWLPWLGRTTVEMYPGYAHLRLPILFGLYVTVIPFTIALYQAFKLLNYIESKNAFSDLAIVSLRSIKNCAIIISALYIVGVVFLIIENAMHPGVAMIGFSILFASLTISFFAAVLQELLRSAFEIKTENDLTI